jgi:hypothetical protein
MVGKEYEVTITTSSEKFRADSLGHEKSRILNDYIDVAIFAEPINKDNLGKVLNYQRVRINKKENTFVFRTKEKPYQVGIDPYNYLIDRIPDDNIKKLEEL